MAGPIPNEANISPIARPKCRRNHIIAAGIRGTRNIA
ncbi:MAG: hypothetical protein CM1200mP3_00530 [Chloroflexota bacterium]|nr:MAG: hypothetical protein CM1200mP3_00530 [Chloroflexota bacterium]